jgi:hypothetical protein
VRRTTFIAAYALGVGVVWFVGSPWLSVNAMLLGASASVVGLDVGFWTALVAPVGLIVVAAVRGKAAAQPRLFLFPLCAFGVSALAFIYGWLSRAVTGEEASILPMQFVVAIGVTSLFGPLVIHVVCCIIGAAPRTLKARAATP